MSRSAKHRVDHTRRRNRSINLASRVSTFLEEPLAPLDANPARIAEWTDFYRQLREIGMHLNHEIMEYLDKEGIHESGRQLGILQGDMLVFEDENESSLLFDHAIYNYRPAGKNAVERYWEDNEHPAGSLEAQWLEATRRSRHSIFLVTGTIRGFGLRCRDILTGDSVLVADINFSKSAIAGLCIATRLLPFDNFWVTSGVPLPILDDNVLLEVSRYIARVCSKVKDFRNLAPGRALLLESFITQTCLAARSIQNVKYTDPV